MSITPEGRDSWATSNPPPEPVVNDFFKSFSNHALGQLKLWLDDQVDQSSTGGDYVFLQQKISEDDSTIVFTNIPQGYRHLVVEFDGGYYQGIQTGAGSLTVRFGASNPPAGDYWPAEVTFDTSTSDPATPDGVGPGGVTSTDYGYIVGPLPNPEVDLAESLPSVDYSAFVGVTAAVTMKFPYYTRTDRLKKCLFHGHAVIDVGVSASSVGGITLVSTEGLDPVSVIEIGGDMALSAGSIATLYGIR